MKRNSFRTKNILERHSLFYITLMLFVLLFFFLVLGNVGKIVRTANLDSGQADHQIIDHILTEGSGEIVSSKVKPGPAPEILASYTGGNGDKRIALWGDEKILDALSSQLMIMDQSYDRLASLLPDAGDYALLVVAEEDLTEADLSRLSEYVKAGGNVWFTNITASLAGTESAKNLMGILEAGKTKTWPGARLSGDIALGTVMEDTEYKVSAVELKLSNKIKLFASALPKDYKEIENKDLPPLIWRYIAEDSEGAVYVCNGDFMETEALYFMLPTILSELQENYCYGVINSYGVFVEGFPYTKNETRESWQRLYSRDKMAIAQDLLSAQYLGYYRDHNARITYFSRDYQEFLATKDRNLRYYLDNIENSMGLLALKDNKGLFLGNNTEKLDIRDWTNDFSFTDQGNYCLPVNYEFTIENEEEVTFSMMGSVMGLGYYTFSNDVDLLLDYDGAEDVWDEYCKKQEVVFGIGDKMCKWLERLTASQALERLYSHLKANTGISYSENGIRVRTDAEEYWMILKGKTEEIEITGGTAEPIGERCWLICVNEKEAVITYK